jgi:hypothetical protein
VGFALSRRQNIHFVDFTLVFYSLMDRLGISRLSRIRYFSTDFRPASPASKMVFLTFDIPIACLCLPYSVLETLGNGNGENLTVTAHKAA